METYRKINQWTSHSRDMVESFKRYYNNSFVDGQRQEAYNLFLGNYIFAQGQPMLWDLSTDYYLHHADPRLWSAKNRKSYTKWFTEGHFTPRLLEPASLRHVRPTTNQMEELDDYWLEYYRPSVISSFPKMYSFRMKSTLRYIPFGSTSPKGPRDLSPFHVRIGQERESASRTGRKKGVKISDSPDVLNIDSYQDLPEKPISSPISQEQQSGEPYRQPRPGILKDLQLGNENDVATAQNTPSTGYIKDKAAATQWTFDQFVVNSLSPVVSTNELAEYGRYISHPLNLPLVTSTNDPGLARSEFRSWLDVGSAGINPRLHPEESAIQYNQYLVVEKEPLTVNEADTPKKRYKAYRQWLKGKSLFKQPRTDS